MHTAAIREGMIVRSTDGEKLGKVVSIHADRFVIEKGFFFRRDYIAHHDHVAGVRDGEILLRLDSSSLREASSTPAEPGKRAGGEVRRPAETVPAGATEDLRIPVAEEELFVAKRTKQAGEVKIRKEVKTEHRQISVPVTREEVRVERVPAPGDAQAGDAAFQEGTFTVAVREEEVEIRKRPVVREEVHVSKTQRQEERRADATVRKEVVHVDEAGDVHAGGRATGPDGVSTKA